MTQKIIKDFGNGNDNRSRMGYIHAFQKRSIKKHRINLVFFYWSIKNNIIIFFIIND